MAKRGGRNEYTSDDEQYLVRYIATYCPGPAGRQGNKLYTTLEENADKKWSWSSRHTWQSWRERYKKRQDWFDREIRHYQRRKGLPEEHSKPRYRTESPIKKKSTKPSTDAKKRKRLENSEDVQVKEKRVKHEEDVVEESSNHNGRNVADVKKGAARASKSVTRRVASTKTSRAGIDSGKPEPIPRKAMKKGPANTHALFLSSEDEDELPVNSDDYGNEVFAVKEEEEEEEEEEEVDQLDESQVNGMLTDAEVDDRPSSLPPPSSSAPLDPDPNDPPPLRMRSKTPTALLNEKTPPRSHPSQEPTPTVSAAVDSNAHIPSSSALARTSQRVNGFKNEAISPPIPSKAKATKPTLKRRRVVDDDPFASLSPTPSPPEPAQRPQHRDYDHFSSSPAPVQGPQHRRRPPVLKEGPYRNTYGPSQRIGAGEFDSSEEEEPKKLWPPKRENRGATVANAPKLQKQNFATPTVIQDTDMVQDTCKPTTSVVKPIIFKPSVALAQFNASKVTITASSKKLPRPAQYAEPNAVASSSKVMLPPSDIRNADELWSKVIDKNSASAKAKSTTENLESISSASKRPADQSHIRNKEIGNLPVRQASKALIPAKPLESKQQNGVQKPNGIAPTVSVSAPPLNGKVDRTMQPPMQPPIARKLIRPISFEQVDSRQAGSNQSGHIPNRDVKEKISAGSSRYTSAGGTGASTTLVYDSSEFATEPSSPDDVFRSRRRHPKDDTSAVVTGDERGRESRQSVDKPAHRTAASIPHIDLRETSLLKYSLRRSLTGGVKASSTEYSPPRNASRNSSRSHSRRSRRSSVDSSVSQNEEEYFKKLGMKFALSAIAKHYGFLDEVAWNVYKEVKNLEKTKRVLACIRDVGGAAGTEMVEKLVSDEGSESEVESPPRDARWGRSSKLTDHPKVEDDRHRRRRSSLTKPVFKVKPLVDDEQVLEYTPPQSSRAGEFVRLLSQGRVEEALSRERRRASGVQIMPYSQPLRFSQPQYVEQESPSPPQQLDRGKKIAEPEDVVMELEPQEQDDDIPMSPPRTPEARENSEEIIDPLFLEREIEHGKLAAAVTVDDADAMLAFEEEEGDPDHMVVYSLNRLRELTGMPVLRS